jgi:hypothetical protein
MITAELQHRDYIGYKDIASQFSSLSFYGNPSVIQPLNELSGLMKDSQKIKNNVKIKCLNAKKDDNIAKITLLSGQLRDLKKRLLTNLLVKDARIRINQIKDEIQREFRVTYSERHLRRLIFDLGLLDIINSNKIK